MSESEYETCSDGEEVSNMPESYPLFINIYDKYVKEVNKELQKIWNKYKGKEKKTRIKILTKKYPFLKNIKFNGKCKKLPIYTMLFGDFIKDRRLLYKKNEDGTKNENYIGKKNIKIIKKYI